MTVVICDDHQLFGESLAVVMEQHGYEIAAITTTPETGVQAVLDHAADLCIMDLTFPEPLEDGIAAACRLRVDSPDTTIIMLTATSDATAFARAISAGVTGFARKDQDVRGVLDTIDRVVAGDVVIDAVSLRAAVSVQHRPLSDGERLAKFLTHREREVLELLTLGYSTQRIAESTGVAYSTARTHIQNLLVKLGVHSRLEASAFAVAHGLVPSRHGKDALPTA